MCALELWIYFDNYLLRHAWIQLHLQQSVLKWHARNLHKTTFHFETLAQISSSNQVFNTPYCVRSSQQETQQLSWLGVVPFMEQAKENTETISTIGWQYLGTESGLTFQFPNIRPESCGSYDPRSR